MFFYLPALTDAEIRVSTATQTFGGTMSTASAHATANVVLQRSFSKGRFQTLLSSSIDFVQVLRSNASHRICPYAFFDITAF